MRMALPTTSRDSVTGGIISRPSCGSTSCNLHAHTKAGLQASKSALMN